MQSANQPRSGPGRLVRRGGAAAALLIASPTAWSQGQRSLQEPPSAADLAAQPGAKVAPGEAEAAFWKLVDPLGVISPADPMPPTGIEDELLQIRPGVALKRELDKLAAQTNLRIGFANTMLFQQASGGPGRRSAGGGDVDMLARWTALGAGNKDTGVVAFAAEYRYQIGDQTPSALGGEIGTLIPTTNSFSERPMVVKELYWDQRLFNDRFRYVLGRIDPENLFGGHRLQSANTFFLNKAFSGNPSVAYPGPGLAAAAQAKPAPWCFLTGGVADANGKATIGNFEGFFEDGEFLLFGEAGFTPDIDGLGAGRYRLAVWHIDDREDARKPSDRGFTISCDQDIGESLIVFARYGCSDGDVTGVSDSLQGGVGIRNVLGQESMLGLAAAWSRPEAADESDENVLEIFHRFQLNQTTQFTIGAESIFDPSNAPGDEVVGVFSVRLRISF